MKFYIEEEPNLSIQLRKKKPTKVTLSKKEKLKQAMKQTISEYQEMMRNTSDAKEY